MAGRVRTSDRFLRFQEIWPLFAGSACAIDDGMGINASFPIKPYRSVLYTSIQVCMVMSWDID